MKQKAKQVTDGIEINLHDEFVDIATGAIAAYRHSDEDLQPGKFAAREHGGKKYLILEDNDRPLAVYRIEAGGRLKSLNRWPKAIETA